jgi:hypothetical protein
MNGGDDSARNIPSTYWHVNKHEALIDRQGYPVIIFSAICVYRLARHLRGIHALTYGRFHGN